MARTESVALGGYYPTPPHLMGVIARLIVPPPGRPRISIMDPCAADGDAITTLVDRIFNITADAAGVRGETPDVRYYTCEIEKTRYKALHDRVSWQNHATTLEGDAFRIVLNRGTASGIDLLFLNPPYDTDPVHGRLEQKFLVRFGPALATRGVLVFVVPFYALASSAETLAREYEDLQCYRFPGSDFDGYKQIVLYARRCTPLLDPDPAILAQVHAWAMDANSIPELSDTTGATYELYGSKEWDAGLAEWAMKPIDITGLLSKVRPWMHSTRTGELVRVPNVLSDLPVTELLTRKYPVATPPRPAHIAAGIASGLFNGSRIEPTDPKSGLPSLLVKGVFDKEYKTIEEKKDKNGDVKALVQVQQPRLVTTVLDLVSHQYHVLGSGAESQGIPTVDRLTVADLLKHYGISLMAVMEQQCPITYDPRKDAPSIPLPPSPRRMFNAQGHAVRALVRLLGGPTARKSARRGKAAILLGEIGSGKSTVALMTARTIGARRMLIMCPPHLLKGWSNEVESVLPDAEVRVLTSITDVDAIQNVPADRTVIAILSRETAKLSHGWAGADGICPKCGQPTPDGVDLAKKRSRCEHRPLQCRTALGEIVVRLGYALIPYAQSPVLRSILRGRFDHRRLEIMAAHKEAGRKAPVYKIPSALLQECLVHLLGMWNGGDAINTAIAYALVALDDVEATAKVARAIRMFRTDYDYRADSFLRSLCLLLPPGSDIQTALIQDVRNTRATYEYNAWDLSKLVTALQEGKTEYGATVDRLPIGFQKGKITLNNVRSGTSAAVVETLRCVANLAGFELGPVCGEPLFQAVPEPRRVALARYISQRHPTMFDFLTLDEGHEYQTDGSAQERSAHRLTSLGIPTVLMTGTIMNGYAESLFTNMWALSPAFRQEFDRDERQRFVDRYGYRKRLVEDRDKESGKIVEFGAMSDRVTRSERVVGNAPGVLPLFLLRHLLPISVTLHKSDLAIDLPACTQKRHLVDPGPELHSRYKRLKDTLVAQIKEDQWEPDLMGRLWGQLAELPSYLDRATADTGNSESGAYEIRYPESLDSRLVTLQEPFDKAHLLPKEEWLLDTVEAELREGRNVMVFSWHVTMLPRLSRLIAERIGETVPVLYADKVATGKRQDWIDREVVRKNRRVLVTNPVAIQTGLNNLVHFATEIWMENPACNPVTYRQAIGRVDRIGQTKPTRIHTPIYADTMQVAMYDLLMRKVAISVSTDGLDPESALQAAGVGEDEYLTGLSIGKQLWAMLTDGTHRGDDEPVYHARSTSSTSTGPVRDSGIIGIMSMLDEMAAAG